ncbi:MAG TPA: GGDEF domain-containing protein [Sedimentisphaerales bacterium]|nr:GGDEF domain-containing protein [Sedimentisphaerales bacterium]
MSAVNKHISRYGDARKILLIGDVGKAFLDVNAATETRTEICADMPQALDIAARKNFAAIAIVMSGISARLSSDLKALRDNCDAKIILLAQMYEEPIAIHLVDSTYNGSSLADDYLICPVSADRFYESIMTAVDRGKTETAPSVAVDTTTETRIRYLERLATEDDLTGLKNRRYMWEFSRQIIEYAKKENVRVTLLVFDVDNLKQYNDIYGHYAGDEILKQAAVLMQRCCRGHDVVGRIGGDEFAVIFWDDPQHKRAAAPSKSDERRSANADHPAEAIIIAKRFVKELGKAGFSSFGGLGPEGKGVLTISGGLASFPRDGRTIEELFQQADKALLEAKRSGKNRIYLVGKPQNDITDID